MNLWMHREMLYDRIRTKAYEKAVTNIVKNGDVVLDVGSGTGIMAMFAAKAGESKVYAVERTGITEMAKKSYKQMDCKTL